MLSLEVEKVLDQEDVSCSRKRSIRLSLCFLSERTFLVGCLFLTVNVDSGQS